MNANTPRTITALALAAMLLGSIPLAAAQDQGWILTTDYGAFGQVRAFGLAAPWTMSGDLAAVPGDPVARHHDDLLYVVGRGNSNVIQVYDPAAGFALVREFSVGAGRNPQDIAFDAEGDAYVSCYDQAVLLRMDVAAETILETIDTSLFADADGLPETAWMQMLDGRLYVTCQKLDRDYYYTPTGPGALLVLDTATEQWVDMDPGRTGIQPIPLQGGDPYTRLEVVRDGAEGPFLRVGCVGWYGLQDGGLEEIDPATGQSRGFLVDEAAIGGDIIGFTGTGPGSVHVLVSDASLHTSLRRVDLATGLVTVLDSSSGYGHADVAYDGGSLLYLADRTTGATGLRVFDTVSGAELTAGPIPTGLPPFQIVLPWNGGYSPVADLPAFAGNLDLARPYPNPCNPGAAVRIAGTPGARVRIGVVDLRGRRVAEATVGLDANGTASYRFTGRDAGGRDLAAGLYRITAQGSDGFAVRNVLLVR